MTADLALLAADPDALERSADPATYVINVMERAKTWLRHALDYGDIEQIAEVKSQAEAIRVYTMQKQLGKDAQLSATEVVRRAERGIGVAIRKGQEAGTIRSRGSDTRTDLPDRPVNNQLVSPTEFVSADELYGNGAGIYDMTDGVSDEDFEAAIGEARAEGKLARANVVRKVQAKARSHEWIPEPGDRSGDAPVQRRKLIGTWAGQGYSSRQMSERLGMRDDVIRRIAREMGTEITADAVIKGTHTHDSNRIVRETVHALEGLAMGIQLVEPGDLDRDEIQAWAASLTQSVRVLNRLIKTLKETAR